MPPAVSIAVPTTYLSLAGVLAFLVILSLWREAHMLNTGMFFSRSFVAVAFVFSRLLVVVFTASIIAGPVFPPVVYMSLNLVCMFFAAYCMQEWIRTTSKAMQNGDAVGRGEMPEGKNDVDADRAALKSLRWHAIIGGAVGIAGYWVVPHPAGMGYSLTGLADAVLFSATVGTIVRMGSFAWGAPSQLRALVAALVVSLAGSWLFVIAGSYTSGALAEGFVRAARVADVLALVTALLSLQTFYQIVGFYHRNRAQVTEEAAAKARAELDLLSRVASDIYEDSSTMIQRQQDHSRDLMRRIDGLEKILQIGIQIQKTKNLRQLLQMVAESVRDNLGFSTVILRMLNPRTDNFETKAFVGVNPDIQDAIMSHRLPMAEFEQLTEPRYRISRSYFVADRTPSGQPDEDSSDAGVLADGWSGIERLVVPFVDDNDAVIGYMSVEDPVDTNQSVVETIDHLEAIATLAVTAIRNATYYRDVAEKNEKLKLYADKLSGLNKMKSNFVATISHEFRTPLTSIKAYCETLLKNADNVDRGILKEFLIVIDEESDRLMTLIEDILDFSQMESGAIKFERTPCDMTETMLTGLRELEKNFQRKSISVEATLPDDPVMVRAEKELMKQLVINLLHNASKFTPEGGQVWARLEDENVSARIIVEDDGIGIPDDELEKIFDHFHQADNTSTREYGGSGLGLAICKNIVDWHDGKIWVENIPGRGARFVAVIPKKQAMVRSHVLNTHGTMRRYEVERYLELIVEMVAELMNVKKASLMMLDPADRELRIDCAIGLDEEIIEHARMKVGEGIAGKVAQDNRSYLVQDIENDNRVSAKNNNYLYDSRSFLSVPVSRDGRVLGVVNVANPTTKEQFDWDDCRLLEVFAARVAIALERLRDFTDTYADFETVRATLKSMLDAKRYVDDQSAGAMSDVLSDLAEKLRLSAEETATLQYAFSVYDLGLARVGYNIIKQPRTMNSQDRNNIEQHPVIGTEMLRHIEHSSDVSDAVLYHHENWDGSGYPARLTGEEIPLNARVIRVADTFRALVSHRPYQKRYTPREAIEVLKHRAGTLFDPNVVKAFVEVVASHMDRFEAIKPRNQAAPLVEIEGLGTKDETSV